MIDSDSAVEVGAFTEDNFNARALGWINWEHLQLVGIFRIKILVVLETCSIRFCNFDPTIFSDKSTLKHELQFAYGSSLFKFDLKYLKQYSWDLNSEHSNNGTIC